LAANGVVLGSKPVPLGAEFENGHGVALGWFRAVTDVIGPAIDDRLHMVAGVPPVLAAIGALGHPLVNSNDGDRQVRKAHALAKLKPVRWEKGDRWVGLCGKKTPKGRFSVGGPKEYAHLAYTALAQEESENYIRR
jgi:hypothetical protein